MITVIGQLTTSRGLCQEVDAAGTPYPYSLEAVAYFRNQPARIPIYIDHDHSWQLGEVVHLERSKADGLLMVGRVDDENASLLNDHQWFLSDQVVCRPMGQFVKGQATMREVSLVARTANLGTRPVVWSKVDVALTAGGHPRGLPLRWHDTLDRAHQRASSQRFRRVPDHLVIDDRDPLDAVEELLTDPDAAYARSRAMTAAMPKPPLVRAPAPTPKRTPKVPLVNFEGVLLDERRSAIFHAALEENGLLDEARDAVLTSL